MGDLVNLQPVADVVNNVINKLSSAAGWIAVHDTPYKTAISTYIQEIQQSSFDPLTKAVLISNAKKTIKEYSNQQSVVKIALDSIKETAEPEKVDPDWISQFMDKARLVSDTEFQVIWGSILAEECNEPGSIPRVLLHSLEQMDKSMAEAFAAIASTSVRIVDDGKISCSPIIIREYLDGVYKEIGIDYDSLVNLQSIGLIETNFSSLTVDYVLKCYTQPIVVHYHGSTYQFPDDITQMPVGNVIYTKAGEALCKSIIPNEIDSFFESYCIPFWDRSKTSENVSNN